MENQYYPIQPVAISVPGFSGSVTSMYCLIQYQVGMTEMAVPYALADNTLRAQWQGTVVINEAELDQWGTDNMYIVNLVAQKAGVTLV